MSARTQPLSLNPERLRCGRCGPIVLRICAGSRCRAYVEEQWTEKTFVDPSREPYEAERREQKLVAAFQSHLRRAGHTVSRLKILPRGEAKPLFSDLYDETENLLVEAKGTTHRDAIRMAIGQLLDYKRFVDPAPKLAILVPHPPRGDLQELCRSAGVALVWRVSDGFAGPEDGAVSTNGAR